MTVPPALRAAADEAGAWLFGAAIPLWIAYGVDRAQGGFRESLDPVTLQSPAGYKRLRTLTRQIYVFAQGALHGVDGADEAVGHGLAFLFGSMRLADGGFASRCDLVGAIIDPTRDLYDLAFVLFALAHAYRLRRDPALRDEALALLAFIDTRMRHAAGGFVEALPPRLPRRQNPHMHLFEAALACAEHMPDSRFDALCDELAGLCARRFLDGGVLREYYDEDLAPLRDDHGRALIEPGHHLSWAWLLDDYRRIRGRAAADGTGLVRFALKHGLDPATGLLRGELFDDGSVATATVRLWPHGEWLKAALALPAAAGDPLPAWQAMRRFLDVPVAGLWHERWDAETQAFAAEPAPATTLYHITTAILELRRHATAAGA